MGGGPAGLWSASPGKLANLRCLSLVEPLIDIRAELQVAVLQRHRRVGPSARNRAGGTGRALALGRKSRCIADAP